MSCAFVLSVILTFAIPSECSVLDPCVNPVIIPKGKYRGTECGYKSGKEINDRFINDKLWYKAVGLNGPLSMPTHPVNMTKCSTILPIWMNGMHPNTGETVNRTACVSGPNMNYCKAEQHILVKNCSTFNVYKLQAPPGVDMAYCFGENEPCPPTDPCADIDRDELLDDGHRAPTCSQTDLCDDNINGWYRVSKPESDIGLKMADKCPRPGYCGATSPIWLEETHPTPSDGIVTRDACVRNKTDCCGERFQIKVVNCGSYYVYELSNRTTCPERYCFGNVDNDIACVAINNTFGHNSGFHLQTNTVLEVISAFLLPWMCSLRWQ